MLTFTFSLLLGWILSGWAGFRWSGYSDEVIWAKHPAAAWADFATTGHRFLEAIGSILLAIVCAVCAFILPDLAAMFAGAILLLLFIPVPYYFFDAARRDKRLRSFEYVHFNILRPPTTHHARQNTEDGLMVEVGTRLIFYISDKQWEKKRHISDSEKKYLSAFIVAPGLYITKATNDVLQTFDSLNLYEHILSPENTAAVEAFKNALLQAEDLKERLAAMQTLMASSSEQEAAPAPTKARTQQVARAAKPATAQVTKAPEPVPVVEPEPEIQTTQEEGEAEEFVVDEDDTPSPSGSVVPPDPLPKLPVPLGMTMVIGAINSPERGKGKRGGGRRKKTDGSQVSLDIGVGETPAPASDAGKSSFTWKMDEQEQP